jgi:hypothetical protein
VARAGRKRKGFRREPNGRAQRKTKDECLEERVHIARNQPHRQGLKSNDKTSELAESALGRLSLRGLLTPGERTAGERFAGIVGAYRSVIEGPRPVRSLMPETASEHAPATDEIGGPRFDCPSQYGDVIERHIAIGDVRLVARTWPCQLPGETCACVERRDRYACAYEAIANCAAGAAAAESIGRRAVLAVIRVAVRGEEPRPEELVYLKRGLAAAARHLQLTDLDR